MRSSQRMIEEFLKSSIWLDMKDALDDWVEGIKTEVFQVDTMDEVRRYQGRLQALEYFLGLPQSLINAIKFEEETKDGSRHD